MAITFTGTVATDLINGSGLGSQHLFCIENSLQSRVKVYIRRAYFLMDSLVALTAMKPWVRTFRATNVIAVENVIAYTKGKFDSTQTSDTGVKIWSGATPAYTGLSGLSATLGNRLWTNEGFREHTLVEQVRAEANNVLPSIVTKSNFVLYPGESIICQIIPAANTSDTFANFYAFNAVWQEEPIAVHSISGTVTNGGTGVVGAKVTVLVADDTALTNAYLWATVTTGAGGTWSCANIPDGKIAYAYAQNYTGGIYYTAAGAPFVS